jgi:hypothetical protein
VELHNKPTKCSSIDSQVIYECLLRSLIEEGKLKHSIVTGIDKEEDIRKVGRCLSSIARASEEIASKLVYIIDINGLSAKMEELDASMNGAFSRYFDCK